MLLIGGSERLWLGASEWLAAGASETLWLGSSEKAWLGGSELLGASERAPASRFAGASEQLLGRAERWGGRPDERDAKEK
jgi:hypothetical protein